MGFGKGKLAMIWSYEDKGNYGVADMSTSAKNKQTDKYEKDWGNKFVRLIGTAHEQAKAFGSNEKVKIGACEVTNKYDSVKKETYTNYLIFGFEDANSKDGASASVGSSKSKGELNKVDDNLNDDELPFA